MARQVSERVLAASLERQDAEVVDLSSDDVAAGRFAEAVGGSLFASSSIVVVRDLTALPADQDDLIVRTAAHPGDDLCLTIVHPGGVKGKALLDKLGKVGVPRSAVSPVKPWQLPQFVTAEAKRVKLHVDGPAATALVDAVGTDLPAIASAVAQLASDWPGERVSVELVNRYFAGRAEVSGFAISDAVLSGRTEQALRLLRWGFDTGTPAPLVTSALASGLRAIGKYLGLGGQRLSEGDTARLLGVQPWKIKDVATQAKGWTPAGVASAITAVAQADAETKGASTDAQFALERLILLLSRARG